MAWAAVMLDSLTEAVALSLHFVEFWEFSGEFSI